MSKKGVVKWFNDAKGFGFLTQEKGPDVFVHFTAVNREGFRTLNEGEKVTFELTNGPNGLTAQDVRPVVEPDWHKFSLELKALPIAFRVKFRDFLKPLNLEKCPLGKFLRDTMPGRETCGFCHFEAPVGHKFCGMCGRSLDAVSK